MRFHLGARKRLHKQPEGAYMPKMRKRAVELVRRRKKSSVALVPCCRALITKPIKRIKPYKV